MVAVLTPNTFPQNQSPSGRGVSDGRGDSGGRGEHRPQLRVITGGAAPARVETRPRPLMLAAGVIVVMLFVVFRVAQGTPPAASWDGLADNAYGSPNAGAAVGAAGEGALQGESVYVVQPGDTLWAIALSLAPGEDPRPLVDQLAERNGGSALSVGQQLILPDGF